jgi:two-component system, OmpR family, response regulator
MFLSTDSTYYPTMTHRVATRVSSQYEAKTPREPPPSLWHIYRDGGTTGASLRLADSHDWTVATVAWRHGAAVNLPRAPIDIVLLEFQCEGMVDTSSLSTLRSILPGTPIIVLANKISAIDRIIALELGADDVIETPAHPRELSARIKAILRARNSSQSASPGHMRVGPLTVDLIQRCVKKGDQAVQLTSTEYWLLRALLDAKGKPVSREAIVAYLNANGDEGSRGARGIDVIVTRLRRKLDTSGEESLVVTVRNIGYRL